MPLDIDWVGYRPLVALQPKTSVQDLGLVIQKTGWEYPRTGRPSSYDQLEPVTRRWHILNIGEVVTEVQPGIVSTKRKVLALTVHDVTLTFKSANQAYKVEGCYYSNSFSGLTHGAGKFKLFESRKSKAARQKLVIEDTEGWRPSDAQLHTML